MPDTTTSPATATPGSVSTDVSGAATVSVLNANAAPTTILAPASAEPAAPAPAGSAPGSAGPDSTTTPAGTIPPPTDGAPAPSGDSAAAPEGASQPVVEASPFDKRLRDTQAAFHAKATEAARYKRDLTTILTHPDLGPVARRALDGIPADGAVPEDPVEVALKAYREAPDDKVNEAYADLRRAEREQSKREILAEIEARDVQAENQQRAHRQNVLTARSVNGLVRDMAPDVDLELFWMACQLPGLVPDPRIQDPADRVFDQAQRAIAFVRTKTAPVAEGAARAATESAFNTRTTAPVMPGGGARPSAVTEGGGEARPSTFVEILAADQAGYLARR